MNKIASEYDGSGDVLRGYVYLSREAGPVSTWEANGNINYLQHDRLGTLVALSGGPSAGATLITNWYAQPDYGTTDLYTNGVTFGYAGYYFDQETGLYKTASRYYDPRLGRFLTPDPIGQQGGLNIYAYAQNDPLDLTDPSGLTPGPLGGNANPAYSLLAVGTTAAFAAAEPCGIGEAAAVAVVAAGAVVLNANQQAAVSARHSLAACGCNARKAAQPSTSRGPTFWYAAGNFNAWASLRIH